MIPTRTLGTSGPTVSAIGLGAMGMSHMYGASDRSESIATVHAALDAGINLIDTGDFYGSGHNELLIHEALAGRNRDDVLISVKFGALARPGGRVGRVRRPSGRREELAGADARAARHGSRRHLPSGTARSERSDRGDGRRDRRDGAGRLRALHRALGSVGRDDSPRAGRAPDLRSADRVLADLARDRGRRSFRRAASWASASPPTASSRAA